ncbi:MAG: alanine--tRNA ligase-related protein [Patescibacteria group bacterium]
MSKTHTDLRNDFKDFWEESPRSHKHIKPASLVLKNDPTTLFTGSGMQQLVPYLMGEKHPQGKKLYNIQPCLRSQDIMEVGDNRHTTFFEMMGNWSLNDYFKEEQINWCFNYFTKTVDLNLKNLHFTVFEGTNDVPEDKESFDLWKSHGVPENHIHKYGVDHNWWSRYGSPTHMPEGEIGGPDSEVFYDFGENLNIHEKSKYAATQCHPNCQCGRFLEIGNSVFIQYIKNKNGKLEELSQKNVDYGGGLERIAAAVNNNPDVFETDLYREIVMEIEKNVKKKYSDEKYQSQFRIIADHLKAAVLLIINGVEPSNKEQGYVLRRFIRRTAVKMHQLGGGLTPLPGLESIIDRGILRVYDGVLGIDRSKQRSNVISVISKEAGKFSKTLDKGLREIEKLDFIDGKTAFDLYQSFGFPLEITEEFAMVKNIKIDDESFYKDFTIELQKHQETSRKSAKKRFGH